MHTDYLLLKPVDGRPPDWACPALVQHVRHGSKLLRDCQGLTCWWNVLRKSLLVGWPKPQGDGVAGVCEIPVVHPDGVTPDLWSFDALNRDLYLRKASKATKQRWYKQTMFNKERERRESIHRRAHDSAMLGQAEDRVRFGMHKAEQGKHSKRKVLVNGLKE